MKQEYIVEESNGVFPFLAQMVNGKVRNVRCPFQNEADCGGWCALFEYRVTGIDGKEVQLWCGRGRTITITVTKVENNSVGLRSGAHANPSQ